LKDSNWETALRPVREEYRKFTALLPLDNAKHLMCCSCHYRWEVLASLTVIEHKEHILPVYQMRSW